MNLYLKRLQKRFPDVDFSQYEEGNLTGEKYRQLMSYIISDNTQKVSTRVAQISKNNFDEQIKRSKGHFKALTPDVSEVLPKRSVIVRKASERGKGITDNLRDTLTKNLREVIQNPDYLRQRGKNAGTLKKDVVKEFEKTIRSTFEGYSKKNPAYGVPSNIHNIAVTEVKSTVNYMKHEYTRVLVEQNPNIEVVKVWLHNPSGISIKHPREGHLSLNGTTVSMESSFVLRGEGGKKYYPLHPHDEKLPPEEIIGCSCEVQYRIRKLPPLNNSVQKAWKLKTGVWHDYDASGKVIEVPAPSDKQSNKQQYNKEVLANYNEANNLTEKLFKVDESSSNKIQDKIREAFKKVANLEGSNKEVFDISLNVSKNVGVLGNIKDISSETKRSTYEKDAVVVKTKIVTDKMEVNYTVGKNEWNGSDEFHIDYLSIKNKENGTGTMYALHLIDKAEKSGCSNITFDAGGNAEDYRFMGSGGAMNGYYTWFALGASGECEVKKILRQYYKNPDPDKEKKWGKLIDKIETHSQNDDGDPRIDVKDIRKLAKNHKEALDFWKNNGCEFESTVDFKDKDNMKIFREYVAEKYKTMKEKINNG